MMHTKENVLGNLLIADTTSVQRKKMFEEAYKLTFTCHGALDDFTIQQMKKFICGERELAEVEQNIYHKYSAYGEHERDDMPLWDNNLAIYNKKILRRLHAAIATIGIVRLDASPAVTMDMKYYMHIHKSLYGGLYAWAGELRTIDMEKYVDPLQCTYRFTRAAHIQRGLSDIFTRTERLIDRITIDGSLCTVFERIGIQEWNRMDDREKTARLVSSIGNMWRIHPFLHGNMLTELYLIVRLCSQIGIPCNRSVLGEYADGNRLEQCMILAYYDPNGLGRIVYRAVSECKYQEEKKMQSGNQQGKYRWVQIEEMIADRKRKIAEEEMLKLRDACLRVDECGDD